MGLSEKYNIQDKNLQKVIGDLETAAKAGKSGNFEIMNREITRNDAAQFVEGKRYVDANNNRMIIKINGKLFATDLSEL